MRPPYPPALASLALDCLAKAPKDRPTMQQVADRLASMSLSKPRRKRIFVIAAIALAALIVLGIVFPRVLDPLCGNWFGAAPFRKLRSGAHHVHDAIF